MLLRKWEDLPLEMQNQKVRPYFEILEKKRGQLATKRIFDLVVSLVMLLLLWPVILVIAAVIAADSPGGVFFRQTRVTTYGREFKIHKFRTMVANADKMGSQVTTGGDARITKIGAFLRKTRLDELPQLIDVIKGDMSFVGTRPEVPVYVDKYTEEMMATLLMPAGITSEASIRFKDEAEILEGAADVDKTYIEEVLPRKMKHNLRSIEEFNFFGEIKTMVRTVFAVAGKEYKDE